VELCLDLVLKQMELDYVDLFLAHWSYASMPISREALQNSKGGPHSTLEEKGMLIQDGKPVINWQYCSANIAKLSGLLQLECLRDMLTRDRQGRKLHSNMESNASSCEEREGSRNWII
jgi:hypothetical protein